MGLRLACHDDDGSKLVGGLLQTVSAYALLPTMGFGLEAAGVCWTVPCLTLGSAASSLVALSPAVSLALTTVSASGVFMGLVLHHLSGFPLLMAPLFLCVYLSFMGLSLLTWALLRLPCRGGLLQPEVLCTALFGLGMFFVAEVLLVDALPEAKMGLLVTSMNALLISMPLILLGCLEVLQPEDAGPERSVYRPWLLLQHGLSTLLQSRDSWAFAVLAGFYVVLWSFIMTTALRLQLWAARPFALLSMSMLCFAAPRRRHWALGFRVPLGLWFLGSVAYAEQSTAGNGDPVLRELLHWLGPQPGPFLELAESILQVLTLSTALQFLAMGAEFANESGERSWIGVSSYWIVSLLALSVRSDSSGFIVGSCISAWAIGLWVAGLHQAPTWAGTAPRLVMLVSAARFCHLGHGGFLVPAAAGSMVGFSILSMLFGEDQRVTSVRQILVHADLAAAAPVSRALAFAACVAVNVYGAVCGEPLLITLGCFCLYVGIAALAGAEWWFIMVAGSGLATMLLGEVVQTVLGPVHTVLGPLFGTGLPVDLRASRALVQELVLVFRGLAPE